MNFMKIMMAHVATTAEKPLRVWNIDPCIFHKKLFPNFQAKAGKSEMCPPKFCASLTSTALSLAAALRLPADWRERAVGPGVPKAAPASLIAGPFRRKSDECWSFVPGMERDRTR